MSMQVAWCVGLVSLLAVISTVTIIPRSPAHNPPPSGPKVDADYRLTWTITDAADNNREYGGRGIALKTRLPNWLSAGKATRVTLFDNAVDYIVDGYVAELRVLDETDGVVRIDVKLNHQMVTQIGKGEIEVRTKSVRRIVHVPLGKASTLRCGKGNLSLVLREWKDAP